MIFALFVSALKVTIDRTLDVCQSGGVRIVAPYAAPAPHQKQVATLEYVKFLPYMESQLPDEQLIQYTNDVLGFIKYSLKRLSKFSLNGREQSFMLLQQEMENIKLEKSDIKKYTSSMQAGTEEQNCHSLMCFLAEVFADQNGDSFSSNARKILEAYEEKLNGDMLLTNNLQTENLKPCLDVVLENNKSTTELKIAEITLGSSIYSKVIPQILNSDPMLNVEYALIGLGLNKFDSDESKHQNILPIPWDFLKLSSPPSQIDSLDFIILDNILHCHDNIPDFLAQLQAMLKPGGFVFIHEWTTNLIIPLAKEVISTEIPISGERSLGPFCSEKSWSYLLTSANFDIIQKNSDGLLSSSFLCR